VGARLTGRGKNERLGAKNRGNGEINHGVRNNGNNRRNNQAITKKEGKNQKRKQEE